MAIHYRVGERAERLEVELAVNGAGRVPRLEGLGLDRAGILVPAPPAVRQPPITRPG